MVRSLVAELKTINGVHANDKINIDYLTDSFKNNFDFEIDVKNNELLPNISAERKFSPMDRMLRELKSVLGMTIIGLVQLNSKKQWKFK